MRGDLFARAVRLAARRPLAVLAVVGALALGGAALALRLEPSSAVDTLVDRSSKTFQDTERFKRDFGDEAIVVLVKGNLQKTVLTSDLGRLLRLEGCLSGNVPERGLRRLPRECREIARRHPARVVFGPATFINTAAGQIGDEFLRERDATTRAADRLAEAARQLSKRTGRSASRFATGSPTCPVSTARTSSRRSCSTRAPAVWACRSRASRTCSRATTPR